MCFPVWDFRFEILDGDFYMAGKNLANVTGHGVNSNIHEDHRETVVRIKVVSSPVL